MGAVAGEKDKGSVGRCEQVESPEWLKTQVDQLTAAVRNHEPDAAAEVARRLAGTGIRVDLYHEVPPELFSPLRNSGCIDASAKSEHHYLGAAVYFGLGEPYGWVFPSPNEDQVVNVILFEGVPIQFTLPVLVRSHEGLPQAAVMVREATFARLEYDEDRSRLYTVMDEGGEGGPTVYLEYKVWRAIGHGLGDEESFKEHSAGKWTNYSHGPFSTFPELGKEQIETLNRLLGVIKVEKAFDPDLGCGSGVYGGVYYDRVYVREKSPLIVSSVAAAVGAVEVVWDARGKELEPAAPINLEEEGSADILVEQLVAEYPSHDSSHGRDHIRRVLESLDLLARDLELDVKKHQLARLAVAGHDIIRGGERPAEESAKVMENMLRGLIDPGDIKVVADAIVQHNKPPEERFDESMVTRLLVDADKLDWSRERYGLDDKPDPADPLEEQFRDETRRILEGVYSERAKRFLRGLLDESLAAGYR